MLVEGTAGQMSKVFITSSGSEAVEAALKAARQYFVEGPNPQPQRHRFIARRQSYHGNTLGSLSISHHKIRKLVYEPLTTTNVSHVSACYPYRGQNDNETDEQYVGRLAQELEDEFQRVGPQTVCGFIVETVSGSTLGVVPPPPGYLKAMKDVCDKHGALFILDEVFCGMGRTGRLHAWETEGVVPHLQTVAKALGGGYQPISALLMHSSVADKIKMGSKFYLHSQTYQAHPVACAAAYEVQKIVQEEGLITNARCMGDYLGSLLKSRLGSHKHVGEVRGRGLMWGIELVEDKDLKTPFPPEKGVSFNIYQTGLKPGYDVMVFPCPGVYEGDSGDAILLTPAFNISREDVELIVDRVARTIEHVLGA
ncbi:hypothetical protein ACKAV7_014071 [Fusarium commune]|nr:hypothetical protein LZL87_013723 [Fusarium oxysporum]